MKKVLVVDDSRESLEMIKTILEDEYQVATVESGSQALQYLDENRVDIVVLDMIMPEMDGEAVLEAMRSNDNRKNIPVLILTSVESVRVEAESLLHGADDFIRKPFDATVLKARIARVLELYDLRFNLEEALYKKSVQLDKMTLSTIITIANTVDAKDPYTAGHSLRVAVCAKDIAKNLGWDDSRVQNIYNVALLHDIGKIAVPSSILNKEGRLTDEEFDIIKGHPAKGKEILSEINILEHVQEGAYCHHEKWDGSGYPQGLKGEEIPIFARVIAVADAYDAMRSNRAYRKHLSKEKIISEFSRCRGSQFDPELADVFLFMLREGYDIDPELVEGWSKTKVLGEESPDDMYIKKVTGEGVSVQLDTLTGLFNKSIINIKVGNRIIKDRCGSLLLIDFDKFGDVNRKYGHLEGDKILKIFAGNLADYFRKEDIVSRMNGDQFAVFVSGARDKKSIKKIAQKIIDDVRKSDLNKQHDYMLSVSIGISMCPDDGLTFGEMYSAADKALYHGALSSVGMYHFFGEEGKVAEIEERNEDMNIIKNMIEGQFADSQGALSVEYDDFQQIYNYVYRYVDRNENHVQVILFTVNPAHGHEIELSILEQSMHFLDSSVVDSLRKVDVGTRYSSNQYIVILTDTDDINGRMVADRVTKEYYNLAGSDATKLSYNLETIQPKRKG